MHAGSAHEIGFPVLTHVRDNIHYTYDVTVGTFRQTQSDFLLKVV